jgi:hypothetical protein
MCVSRKRDGFVDTSTPYMANRNGLRGTRIEIYYLPKSYVHAITPSLTSDTEATTANISNV